MNDPRIGRLARLLVGYSLDLQPGKVVRLDGSDAAVPLLQALYREALAAGAHPYAHVGLEGLAEILVGEGSDAQLEHVSPLALQELERLDALVTVWADGNTKALAGVDAERQSRMLGARRDLSARRMERIFGEGMGWVGTLFPTEAHAQDAEMSLEHYERFVYGACHVQDEGDPVAHWLGVSEELSARARELERVRQLRILGPDTDLRLSVAGRKWVTADGHRNMPDGEVFTGPIEDATEGEIRYQFPAIYQGREVEDVRLRFEGGRVVAAEAASGEDTLLAMLDIEGGRVLGEVAFGLNYEIDRFTRNILFDEKIGGTMHLALGASFPITGGKNRSALHWDMICDLREDGEVYADGELIWKAGRFLRAPRGSSS